jgi:probable HAF family extracellular repeat protein
MKTHPPVPYVPPHPNRYHGLCATLLILATVHGRAACGNGLATITNVPHLGGSSYTVTALNAAGQTAGYSQLPGDQEEHAFRSGPGGSLDLGTLGGSFSYSYAINDAGQVAGESLLPGDFTPPHAFRFDGATLLDLGTLDGVSSTALAINNAGQVAGDLQTAGSTVEAFLYSNGTMTSLGHLGGFYSRAAAINQSGSVVGNSLTEASDQHAFLYTNGTMVDLGSLGGGYSDAFALNDNNVVVGESYLANGELHGFVYSGGTMTDLGTLGGTYSSAFAINNGGQIIGRSRTAADAQMNGFIYSGGIMTDLGTLGGASSTPYAINNLGQIVGQAEQADGAMRAFLWQGGTMTDLNTLLPPNSGWVLDSARFLNDAGRIVGTGTYNEQSQWFIFDLGGANHPPVASAGADQTSECSGTVTLDGSLSSDPDSDTLTYEWSENGLVLGANSTLTASFTTGTHTITLKVSDPCGENSQDTVVVSVGDGTPPTVSCPVNAPTTRKNGCEAVLPDLRSLVVASDNCTPANALTITQSPAAGTLLGSGQYVITMTVTDAAGNAATCTTTITVGDDQPPVIVCVPRPVTVSANDNCQGKVPNYSRYVTARDNCTPTKSLVITQTPAAGTMLDKGEHVVVLTVTDGAGNSTSKNVTLRIKDRTPPKIHSATVTPNILTPANGKNVRVEVTVNATDNCDTAPSSKIVKILCDENTSRGDIKITGDLTAELAASTNARGDGRVYTIIILCRDDAGNTAFKSVTIRVPKAKSQKHRD